MKRNGASSVTVGALFVLGLIIGGGAIYVSGITTSTTTQTSTVTKTVNGSGQTTTITSTVTSQGASCGTCLAGINNTVLQGAVQAGLGYNMSGNYVIGNLVDLTSDLSGEGKEVQATTAFAISDINAWLATTTLHITFSQNLQDYALDNTKLTADLNSYYASGIRITVGPLNSGAAKAGLPFANSNHFVMLSESSTATYDALAGDYLYRTPPADNFQGNADAAEFKQSGVQDVVIVYRNDDYGAGLANATASDFIAAGGQVEAKIPYDITTTNFVAILGTINDAYNSAVGKVGAAHVGLYFVSFNEWGELVTQAQANYPALLQSTLPWFGTDGEGNEAPLVNSTYASASSASRLVASFPGFSSSSLTTSVCARQLAQTNILCDGYSIGAYDDMWIAALSILYCGGQDGVCIHNTLPAVAAGFPGASGVPILNGAGDRLYASYVFFCIVPGSTAGSAKWIVCGTWDQVSNTVVWSVKPQGIP